MTLRPGRVGGAGPAAPRCSERPSSMDPSGPWKALSRIVIGRPSVKPATSASCVASLRASLKAAASARRKRALGSETKKVGPSTGAAPARTAAATTAPARRASRTVARTPCRASKGPTGRPRRLRRRATEIDPVRTSRSTMPVRRSAASTRRSRAEVLRTAAGRVRARARTAKPTRAASLRAVNLASPATEIVRPTSCALPAAGSNSRTDKARTVATRSMRTRWGRQGTGAGGRSRQCGRRPSRFP